ncbi:hypothetical protein [Yinghuangia sp. YIM S10712]|uniref:hypothetical protein n=1 Tax=Yinghuangia sp. YIM S10712 TaxID=3436930 RepID=UPI003F534E16
MTIWSVDTLSDTTLWDAATRAAPLLAPGYLLQNDWLGTQAAALWNIWTYHQAITTVTAELADDMGKPEDTPTEAFHLFALDVRPQGRDAWVGEPLAVMAYVTLARSTPDDPWRVTSIKTM